MSATTDLNAVVTTHEGLSRTVLDFTRTLKELVDNAKTPGFRAEAWDALASFVDIDAFERVGPFKDAMTWHGYVEFLTAWAARSHWECTFKRITETGNLVYLELEERSAPGDAANAANSASVYEFDDDGTIVHLDVYLQMTPPKAT